MSKKNENEIKFLMDHPVFMMHENSAKLVRAQLFFLSICSIFVAYSGVVVGDGSSILGIKLEGLKDNHLFFLLSFLITYQIIHFSWSSWESFCEWRIRQSALGAAELGSPGIKITKEDENLKVRQTTIYSYLVFSLKYDLDELKKKIASFGEDETEEKAIEIESYINKIYKHLEDPRISESLWRFDNWFKMFVRAQNVRWLVLEVSLPLALGFWALTLSICRATLLL